MFKKRKKKGLEEVNASSMADIAFLLLVFFLVATQVASEKGLAILLPPKREDDDDTEIEIKERNLYVVIINSRNQLLVENKQMKIHQLKRGVLEFITNNGRNPDLSDSPGKAIVSLKTDMGTDYKTYIIVLDQIKAAYHELRAKHMGITLKEYLDYNASEEVQNACLKKKVQRFREIQGKTDDGESEDDWIRNYLKYDLEKKDRDPKRRDAYIEARELCGLTLAEKYHDAKHVYPLQISEAEPSQTQ